MVAKKTKSEAFGIIGLTLGILSIIFVFNNGIISWTTSTEAHIVIACFIYYIPFEKYNFSKGDHL